MATISISFNTTAAQDAKLAKILARVNAQRAVPLPPSDGQPQAQPQPYPTVEVWLKDFLIERLRAYVKEQQDIDDRELQARIAQATPQQLAQIETILGG